MFPPALVDRINTSLAAYLTPRDRTLRDNLQAALRQLAAKGMMGSSLMATQFGRIGADELRVRAGIVWNAIQRAHAAAGSPVDAAILNDLRERVALHVNAQAVQVGAVSTGAVPALPGELRGKLVEYIARTINTMAAEILPQLNVEAAFYADQLQRQTAQPVPAASGGITINAGHIGAVQTGTYALAHVTISDQDGARLVGALNELRQALAANQEATADQRVQGDELAGDLVQAVRAERPNGPKISGLLGGLATTVQTVASLRPAWELVRDAAMALGLMVGGMGN